MERRITHTLLSLILAFTICAAPFVDAKRAEAIAPAIPAAAAAGALAAELGISVEALMTGLVAITAAGTGVYLMSSSDGASTLSDAEWRHLWGTGSDTTNPGYTENWGTDYEKYKLGNGKSWDELTNDEQAQWGTPAQYVQSQWLAYLLQNDLIQETGNGGFEPTPEPDPESDPDGNSRWNKSRNTLAALGITGAAVALNDAVGWLGETVGGGIHDFLFGQGATGLGLLYTQDYTVDDLPVVFKAINVNAPFSDSTGDFSVTSTNWYFCNTDLKTFHVIQGGSTPTINLNRTPATSTTFKTTAVSVSPLKTGTIRVKDDGTVQNYAGHYDQIYQTQVFGSTGNNYLNANYAGTYQFAGGAVYSNGRFTDTTGVTQTVGYGEMTDTPEELAQSVVNNNNNVWNNYINNATNDAPEGQKKAVVIPDTLDNPSYDDFVKVTNDEDITPIPDDEPLPNPNPDDPNPPQPPDVDFENDFTHRVNELLSNPFDQLFPFCLIGDMRDFFFIIMGQPQLAQRVDTSNMLSTQSETPINELNGIHTLVIPLNDWGLDDVDNIEFDLDPIHDVGHYVRLIITIVLIMGIVMFSMNFFLKRGA